MVLNARAIFFVSVFVEMDFHIKKKSTAHSLLDTEISQHSAIHMSTMSSPVFTNKEGTKEKKRIKTQIGVGYIIKAKVEETKEKIRQGRTRSMRKEVVVCVNAVVRKKIFLVQFEYGHKKEISSCLLVFLYLKEDIEMDEPLSNPPEKEQGEFLIIDGYLDVGEPCMFGSGVYFSMFYFLC